MLNASEVLEFLRQHRQILRTDLGIVKLGLIGSFARGEQTGKSDIDLLVEFEPGTDDLFDKKMRLRDSLQTSFHREVDICREKYVKPHLKIRLLKEAIYVWE
ncbi:MAG: nucleotidyltransferase family protein [candidate division KSB1 bacterium]|nr:nucleotidyltransferase family protein [candidate division KSB1 bacterium]MDZ7276048.1 nucleotidyltransferase family protein [candidate division KSB1 bacterium]MDZ7285670.1 nucleotidyltransferase family protein [candidate division KSB1 bacterium]MDZ7298702.1 nucleotidyltransferase family protein [candidate division KSB1 bacterium]MDZ7307549.1 nucleotidyltransferase family protein [candidate division KSB1 bacterium]